MGANFFNFKGGVYKPKPGSTIKFLLFLVEGGREIPLSEAKRYGTVSQPNGGDPQPSWVFRNGYVYTTSSSIIKLMLHEQTFGEGKLFYPFYIQTGPLLNDRIIEIKPRCQLTRVIGYHLRVAGRFLTQKEAMSLFDERSSAYSILARTSLPAVPTLKQIITVTKSRESRREDEVRRLRLYRD